MMADNILDYISLISASFKIDEVIENEKITNLKNANDNVKNAAENLKKGSCHLSELSINIEKLSKAITDYIETAESDVENETK